MDIYTAAVTLFLVMDPLGNIPLFLSALNAVEPKRRSWVILRETSIAFVILAIFLLMGPHILKWMSLSEAAISIAGGIILFLIAIRMIFPVADNFAESSIQGEPFIVPLAIPLVAGPSALAVVLLMAVDYPDHLGQGLIVILIASIASTIILLLSNPLRRILGQRGIIATERLMGMILTTIAVQMFLSGIDQYLKLR